MKIYWIFLAAISLTGQIYAQSEGYVDRKWNNETALKTVDGSDQYSNQVRSTAPEQKSTPSQDAGKAENQKDNNKQEPDKKEEKKEEEKSKSPHTFTGNISFVSDYRFRGISQTMRQPAVQGGLDYSHASGIYLGTWASNVDGTTHFYNNTSMEWDFYGGYKNKPFPCCLPDFSYNFGLLYYYYPGGRAHVPKNVRYNTCEYYLEFSYKWFSIKLWESLTDYFGVNSDNPPTNYQKQKTDRPNGSSRGSTYIEANATFALWEKVCWGCLDGGKLSLLLHVGHLNVRNYEHLSYTEWRVTLTQEFDWFNVFLSYVGTNAKHAYYDVPDNSYHPRSRHLGVQGVVCGVIRSF